MTINNLSVQSQVSPFDPVICECGCGTKFIPMRSNQYFLNKNHADKHYNMFKRIKPSEEEKRIVRQLRVNEQVLLAKLNDSQEKLLSLQNVREAGFREKVFSGMVNYKAQKKAFVIFKVAFRIMTGEDGTTNVLIIKL